MFLFAHFFARSMWCNHFSVHPAQQCNMEQLKLSLEFLGDKNNVLEKYPGFKLFLIRMQIDGWNQHKPFSILGYFPYLYDFHHIAWLLELSALARSIFIN